MSHKVPAALVSASPAARRDAALPPSPPGDPPVQWVPFSSTARGSGRTPRVRTEPRAGANPSDRADRQGQGGPDLGPQISAAKTGRPWPIGFCGWPPWGWLAGLSRP